MTTPVRVSPAARPSAPASSGWARPKSSSLTPCAVRKTFDGFRSRWTMPRACSAASADSMPRPIGSASAAVRAPRSSRAAQRLALEQLHGDEDAPGVLADLVDLADVGMVDAGGGAGLAPQPLARGLVRRRRRQRLEGDGPGQPLVAGGVDHAHPAFADLALDRVVADPRRDRPAGAGRGRRDLTGRVVRPARGHGDRRRPCQPLIKGTKASPRSLGSLARHGSRGSYPAGRSAVSPRVGIRRSGAGIRRFPARDDRAGRIWSHGRTRTLPDRSHLDPRRASAPGC